MGNQRWRLLHDHCALNKVKVAAGRTLPVGRHGYRTGARYHKITTL